MRAIPGLAERLPLWLELAWLQRYLDGELEAPEVEAFEAYLLDKPHLVARLDADNLLRAAIAADPAGLGEARVSDIPPGVGERRRRYRVRAGWLNLAAGLVLGVGLTWLGFARLGGLAVEPSAPPRIIYDTLRGELTMPREEAGDPLSPMRLYELPVPAGARVVAAEAVHGGESTSLPVVAPAADGYLTYLVPASWRGQGELHVDIRFSDGQAAGARLTFPL